MKITGTTASTTTPRSDWNQTDPRKADYIKNKPDACLKHPVYTATPGTLADVIKTAEAGAIINLTAGNYGLLNLHGKDSYFAENLTIIGCEGATVAGVSITSGVISDTLQASADISDAILPQGLTFEGVTFTDSFCLRNARVDNLTLDKCVFGEKTNISISPECFVDAYGDDRYSETKGAGSVYRYPYAHLKQKNLVIRDCVLKGATGTPQYENGQASAINVVGVDGVTIYRNETNGGYNGIQVGGQTTDYGVLTCGKVSITKNAVKNTTTRGINVHSIFDGDVTIAENALESINHADKIIVRFSDNITLTWDVWNDNKDYSKPNTCDGKTINVGSGIVVSDSVVLPPEYYSSLTAGVLLYSGSRDENEDKMNAWLDSILAAMSNDTIRKISVRCGGGDGKGVGVIPWPAMGTIHKHTDKYAVIDVTTQVHGKHYTKIKNNGTWQPTTCEEETLRTSLEKKANKTALDTKADKGAIVYEYGTDTTESSFNNWLNSLITNMPNQSMLNISTGHSGAQKLGVIHKYGDTYATVDLTEQGTGFHFSKVKKDGVWGDTVCTDSAYDSGLLYAQTVTVPYSKYFIVEVFTSMAVGGGVGGYDTFTVGTEAIPIGDIRNYYRDFYSTAAGGVQTYSVGVRVTHNNAGSITFSALGEASLDRIIGYN